MRQTVKRLEDPLYVSGEIRTQSASDFLRTTISVDIICNAITALVTPQQYDVGLDAIQLIKQGTHLHGTHPNIDHWISVWSGLAIIVNRKTPWHRDQGGAPTHYDLLLSAGTHTDCVLDIPILGLTLSYLPGTVVAIVGKVIGHGVRVWDGGERICQARFIKDAVHDRLGLVRPEWVNHNTYIGLA